MSDDKRNYEQQEVQGRQKLLIYGRETLELQGVLKVDDFDKQEVHLTTVLGDLVITGEDLHIAHLLLDQEQMVVSGKLNAICFDQCPGGKGGKASKSGKAKKKSSGLLERLTK